MEENLQMGPTEVTSTIENIPSLTSVQDIPSVQATVDAQATTSARNRKQLRNSLLATFALLLVTMTIFVGQTFAYFTDSQHSQQNRISSGHLDVSIVEMDEEGNLDFSGQPLRMMPATVVNYGSGVAIKNTGTLPMYVRIKVEKKILQSENPISPGWEHLIDCNFMAGDTDTYHWVYHEGYYYYKVALQAGEKTPLLFDKVLFSPNMGNEFKNCSIQFILVCQSVQTNGNSDDPLAAWGWPDEPNESTN